MKKVSTRLVRTSRFRYTNRRLWLARARLWEDRIELRGLSWTGLHHRTIPLEDLESVEWWSGDGPETNLALHLKNGDVVLLNVPGPGLWKFAIEEHCRPSRTAEPARSSVRTPAA